MTARPRQGHGAASVMAVVLALGVSACASRAPFVAPAGPGVPAPDATAVWTGLVAACRAVTSYRAEFGLTGQIGARRIRGLASAKLFVALAADGRIGLESSVSGQLVFRLGGDAENAVLLLREPDRVVTAEPEAILDALIGVPVGTARLLAIVAGCVTTAERVERGARHDGTLQVVTSDAVVYLTQVGAGWQPRAARFGDVAVEYFAFRDGLPERLRLMSAPGGRPPVSLDLTVAARQVGAPLDPTLFRVSLPEGATPISLDELRRSGPLAEEGVPSR